MGPRTDLVDLAGEWKTVTPVRNETPIHTAHSIISILTVPYCPEVLNVATQITFG
jgi:hypothetical protein